MVVDMLRFFLVLFNLLESILYLILFVVGFLIIIGFYIVFGELVLKILVIINLEEFVMYIVLFLIMFYKVIYLIMWIFNYSMNLVLKIFGIF